MESSTDLQLKINRKIKELGYIKKIEKAIVKHSKEYSEQILRDAVVLDDTITFLFPSGNNDWCNEILKSVLEIQKVIPSAWMKQNPEDGSDKIRVVNIYGY